MTLCNNLSRVGIFLKVGTLSGDYGILHVRASGNLAVLEYLSSCP